MKCCVIWCLAGLIAALAAGCGGSAQVADPARPSPEQHAAAKTADVPVEITNSISMKMVLIPAGEFQMGSHETAEHAAAFFRETYGGSVNAREMRCEHPQHRVQITKPFYLGKYHVTLGQFRQFVTDTGYKTDAEKGTAGALGWNPEKKTFEGKESKKDYSWRNAGFEQTDEHPVINVSWNDAVAFCEWLSRKEGKTYRLPTEAEQEYACRAGTTTRYYSGDNPETLAKVGNVADFTAKPMFPNLRHTIKANDGYVFTAPVGSFEPNAFGVYDMHGNAWQWCSDARVLRGGSCQSGPVEARSAFRFDVKREGCILWPTGFRVARTQ